MPTLTVYGSHLVRAAFSHWYCTEKFRRFRSLPYCIKLSPWYSRHSCLLGSCWISSALYPSINHIHWQAFPRHWAISEWASRDAFVRIFAFWRVCQISIHKHTESRWITVTFCLLLKCYLNTPDYGVQRSYVYMLNILYGTQPAFILRPKVSINPHFKIMPVDTPLASHNDVLEYSRNDIHNHDVEVGWPLAFHRPSRT